MRTWAVNGFDDKEGRCGVCCAEDGGISTLNTGSSMLAGRPMGEGWLGLVASVRLPPRENEPLGPRAAQMA